MELVPSRFDGRGRPGDFAWMITRPEYADALFVFNDNEEQFRAFQRDPTGGAGLSPGGGNATVRPYRGADPPRAAGIPTGQGGQGYARLTPRRGRRSTTPSSSSPTFSPPVPTSVWSTAPRTPTTTSAPASSRSVTTSSATSWTDSGS